MTTPKKALQNKTKLRTAKMRNTVRLAKRGVTVGSPGATAIAGAKKAQTAKSTAYGQKVSAAKKSTRALQKGMKRKYK